MSELNQGVVRIYNCSEQMIPLSARPPGGDFFLHEQSIYLKSGEHVGLPKAYINMNQIENLQAKGMLRILTDTDNMPVGSAAGNM
jgi:hypothetical protein